jgi:hypothetical protein
MYGLTRATLTLIGVAAVGVLLWLATQIIGDDLTSFPPGEYWAAFGVVAVAGLVIALSQLLGGWTKWGWPQISGKVFLAGFVPAFIVGGWILAAGEPGDGWLGSHVRSWSEDIGIDGLVDDLASMIPAVAFTIGLVFGLTFDTTGPRSTRTKGVPAAGAQRPGTATRDGDGAVDRDRRVRLGGDGQVVGPPPAEEEPAKK